MGDLDGALICLNRNLLKGESWHTSALTLTLTISNPTSDHLSIGDVAGEISDEEDTNGAEDSGNKEVN